MSTGLIAYEGPSRIDGEPVVCIVTHVGEGDKNSNSKIGENMVQTWILRQDVSPTEAINTGADLSICGNCVLRGVLEKSERGTTNRMRGCYVNVANAPRAIWGAYTRGVYKPMEDEIWPGKDTRHGGYGDPAALPYSVVRNISRRGRKSLGYTHQHAQRKFQPLRKFLMASVNSIDEKLDANRRGWRTFRTLLPGDELDSDEFLCPGSAEQAFRLTCEKCLACNGVGEQFSRMFAANVAIYAHGSKATLSGFVKSLQGSSP